MATRHSDKGLELKVGGFVLVGLGVLAALLVQFGRIGEGFQHYYGLLVKFPDASGLLKGSDVLLAGRSTDPPDKPRLPDKAARVVTGGRGNAGASRAALGPRRRGSAA